MIKQLHIIIALLAALVITIEGLYQDITFYELNVRLVIFIPIFFIIGLFFKYYFSKLFAPPEPPPIEQLEEGEHTEDEGDEYDDEYEVEADN